MKNFLRLGCFSLIVLFFSGCRSVCDCRFHGKCEIVQTDHIVKINKLGPGEDFSLTFVGKDNTAPVSIDAIQGSYEYETNSARPLTLYFFRDNRAAFIPDDAVMIRKYQGVVQSRLMKDGHYVFKFNYVLNKQTNSCDFAVRLVTGTRMDFTSWIYYLELLLFYHPAPGG